jgi:hypothetical protein
MRNIADLEMDKLLLETLAKLAEILNPFSSRSFSYFNPALLDFPGRTLTESLSS